MTPYWQDGNLTIYNGDVREMLAGLPDESVHCVVTSPPYWGLRDYGTAEWGGGDADCKHDGTDAGATTARVGRSYQQGHPMLGQCRKCGARRIDQQLGSEPTPESYIETMVNVFRELRRVMRKDAILWLVLGDSYNAGREGGHPGGKHSGFQQVDGRYPNRSGPNAPGLKPKDLCGIPWRLALALQKDGWWLRSAIPWVKRSAMPDSADDRPASALEYVFMLTKSALPYFAMQAVRVKAAPATIERDKYSHILEEDGPQALRHDHETQVDPGGRHFRNTDLFFQSLSPPFGLIACGDEWVGLDITARGLSERHYASYPPKLIEPLIRAGTSLKGCCAKCGAPRERILERKSFSKAPSNTKFDDTMQGGPLSGSGQAYRAAGLEGPPAPKTTGWRDTCECQAESVPCTVLDPFLGSGTTLLVAQGEGCAGIGIELNRDYCDMAKRRLAQGVLEFG